MSTRELSHPDLLEEILMTPNDTAALLEGLSIDEPPEPGVSQWKVKCSALASTPNFIFCVKAEDGTLRRMKIKHITRAEVRKARKRFVNYQRLKELRPDLFEVDVPEKGDLYDSGDQARADG